MKKVMFVVVMLLVASACFAQLQSPPSNVTGYVKFSASAGTPAAPSFTAFGQPFKFWDIGLPGIPTYGSPSTSPSDIFGDQPACNTIGFADRIWRQDGGAQAYRNSSVGCAWGGSLETGAGMEAGRAFWYVNKSGALRDIVMAGEVDNTGDYLSVACAAGVGDAGIFTPYAWRDSRSLDRSTLNLIASGWAGGTLPTNSDQVWQQAGGTFYYDTNGPTFGFNGSLVTLEPGKAFWILNRGSNGGAFNYNYDATGVNGPLSRGISPTKPADNGGSISKIGASPTGKTSVKGARN